MNIPEIPPYPILTPGMPIAAHYNAVNRWIGSVNETIAAFNSLTSGRSDEMAKIIAAAIDRGQRRGTIPPR